MQVSGCMYYTIVLYHNASAWPQEACHIWSSGGSQLFGICHISHSKSTTPTLGATSEACETSQAILKSYWSYQPASHNTVYLLPVRMQAGDQGLLHLLLRKVWRAAIPGLAGNSVV